MSIEVAQSADLLRLVQIWGYRFLAEMLVNINVWKYYMFLHSQQRSRRQSTTCRAPDSNDVAHLLKSPPHVCDLPQGDSFVGRRFNHSSS